MIPAALNRSGRGRVSPPGARPTGASVPPKPAMHRLSRLLVLSTLSLGLAFATACKRNQTASDTTPGAKASEGAGTSTAPKRERRQPGMPRPLRLPADAPIVIHVASPGDAIAGLHAYAPELAAGFYAAEKALAALDQPRRLDEALVQALAIRLSQARDILTFFDPGALAALGQRRDGKDGE
jgi:hypothetical protein